MCFEVRIRKICQMVQYMFNYLPPIFMTDGCSGLTALERNDNSLSEDPHDAAERRCPSLEACIVHSYCLVILLLGLKFKMITTTHDALLCDSSVVRCKVFHIFVKHTASVDSSHWEFCLLSSVSLLMVSISILKILYKIIHLVNVLHIYH